MGLAASQCRFLMLTSRESDVEAKLMSLSNAQMALTNKSTQLSTEYAKRLSEQSVYFNDAAISYSSLMAPNMVADATNNVSQYIFKTGKGAVILSPSMATKCGLAPSQVGQAHAGSGSQFRQMNPDKSAWVNARISEYYASSSSSTSTLDKSQYSEQGLSAYRYEDNLMNGAVVSVQSASVLNLSNYSFDTLEYAMGTGEGQSANAGQGLSSYACIWTLDQYQYTESNIHSIVNSFVENAASEMSKQMSSTLGNSEAVTYATNFAAQKTLEYYKTMGYDFTEQDIKQTLVNMQKKTIYDSDGNVVNGVNPNEVITYRTSTPLIKVSEGDYLTTTTTGVTEGSPNMSITHLTGKDIFVDTAQLTAVYLNYFDAGMLFAMADSIDNGNISGKSTDKSSADLRKYAEVIKAFNEDPYEKGDVSPLLARSLAQTVNDDDNKTNDIIGLNGYDEYGILKSEEYADITNGTTGYYGSSMDESLAEATGNSTIKAQKAFFSYMYDALCSAGWSYNTSITDNKFLSDQMQFGNVVLCEYSARASKGNTLDIDDSSSGLTLVDNADSIEKAEADYEAESAKIDYKTNIIETQMDKLNTELKSIQNEKESVKQIISDSIEKRFNLFS